METEIQLRRMVARSACTRSAAARLQANAYVEALRSARLRATSQALGRALGVVAVPGRPEPTVASMSPENRRRRHLGIVAADLAQARRVLVWTEHDLKVAREENAILRQQLQTVDAQLAETERELAATTVELCDMNRELQDTHNRWAVDREAARREEAGSGVDATLLRLAQ